MDGRVTSPCRRSLTPYLLSMARELGDEAIAAGSGRAWDDWLVYFESVGASKMTHQELVAAASAAGAPSWWRQMVAVKYEQHIGRRMPGQDSTGTFSVSVSKTRAGSLDGVLKSWSELMASRPTLSGVEITEAQISLRHRTGVIGEWASPTDRVSSSISRRSRLRNP